MSTVHLSSSNLLVTSKLRRSDCLLSGSCFSTHNGILKKETCARNKSASFYSQSALCVRAENKALVRTNSERNYADSRRRSLFLLGGSIISLNVGSIPSQATPLAPLGKVKDTIGGPKRSVSIEELKDILADDLAVRQYFITGNLTTEIFADDCRFKDPTNDIVGLARYVKALGILFEESSSSVELISISVTNENTVEADWTLGGTLKLPWKPVINRIQGHTIWTLNNDGLIQVQEQQWNISAGKALRETFTPSLNSNM